MKTLPSLTTALILALGLATAQAADDKKPTAQQQRMADCNKEAGGKQLKGDERKKFMSTCLKGEGAGAGPSQQEKMKRCNKEAGDKQLKGEERKKFMSSCLKG
jgi:hypothetical protein